jgi:hypothetical protein
MTVVSGTARVLVRVSTTLLPSGQTRERYRREHDGELHALAADQQIRYAMGALTTAWALRQAVVQERDMTVSPTKPRKPVLCRLNLHHTWVTERSSGGEWYRRCAKCGKDDPGSYIERDVDGIGPGMVGW